VISQAASVSKASRRAKRSRPGAKDDRELFRQQDSKPIRSASGQRKAGFDPYGAARFLGALGRSAALRSSLMSQYATPEADILATHPSTPDRVAQAINAARQIAPQAAARPTGALSRCHRRHDLWRRSRRRRNPRRKFCTGGSALLSAPEGFVLENASQALLGIRPAAPKPAPRQR